MPKFANITAKEFAKSTGVGQESSEHDSDNLAVLGPHQTVQKILAEEDDSVFEKRVQAIAFLVEVAWIVNDHDLERPKPPLTGAEFRRAVRGVFSPQIREAMGEIDRVYSRVAYVQGNKTRKYTTSKVRDPAREGGSNEETELAAYEIIKEIVEFADNYNFSDDNLMKVCLTLEYVQELETGKPIDLARVSSTI